MSDYLLDTNAVIDLISSASGARGRLAPGSTTRVSIVSEVELRYGVAAAPHDPRRAAQLTALLATWVPMSVDAGVARAFGAVVTTVRAAGQDPRRRMNDLMIAATALAHDLTLVTDDRVLTRALQGLVPVQALT